MKRAPDCDICPAVREDVYLFVKGTPDEYIAKVKEYNTNSAIVANARRLKGRVDEKLTEEDKQNALSVLTSKRHLCLTCPKRRLLPKAALLPSPGLGCPESRITVNPLSAAVEVVGQAAISTLKCIRARGRKQTGVSSSLKTPRSHSRALQGGPQQCLPFYPRRLPSVLQGDPTISVPLEENSLGHIHLYLLTSRGLPPNKPAGPSPVFRAALHLIHP
ncbi:uncharacterized protein LOC122690799 isoform X2 [Cervus elaphus]|uniref:uncharacterized protein LOC122421147 isoform X2 n=1 Tax=Cervus canadensis TaxID=1574408 RepID=UPI001CA3428A|nr:uncharacterized protein LOC122421147 isoform X2 [Cervus canadensis]XP_043753699.1 uncharacterized protein LOC122690799 isoform X2 [Cervus elaphus]